MLIEIITMFWSGISILLQQNSHIDRQKRYFIRVHKLENITYKSYINVLIFFLCMHRWEEISKKHRETILFRSWRHRHGVDSPRGVLFWIQHHLRSLFEAPWVSISPYNHSNSTSGTQITLYEGSECLPVWELDVSYLGESTMCRRAQESGPGSVHPDRLVRGFLGYKQRNELVQKS